MKHSRQWQRHHYSHRTGGALLRPWTSSHLPASSAPELHPRTVAAHAALGSTSWATGFPPGGQAGRGGEQGLAVEEVGRAVTRRAGKGAEARRGGVGAGGQRRRERRGRGGGGGEERGGGGEGDRLG